MASRTDWDEYYRRLAEKEKRRLEVRQRAGYSDTEARCWYYTAREMLQEQKENNPCPNQ